MNYVKKIAFAMMLAVVALFSVGVGMPEAQAAVVHDTTLYSTEPTGISTHDGEYNQLDQYYVYDWNVVVLVHDDAAGSAVITWNTNAGPIAVEYEIGANASTLSQISGPYVNWDPAYLALINLLYPFPW